jgi:hypothetical protein
VRNAVAAAKHRVTVAEVVYVDVPVKTRGVMLRDGDEETARNRKISITKDDAVKSR